MRFVWFILSAGVLLVLGACHRSERARTPTVAAVAGTAQGSGAPEPVGKTARPACAADPSWITSPSMPTDVALPEQNRGFHQFAWQSFLFVTRPTSGGVEFETWMPDEGVFVPAGEQPVAWGTPPPPPPECKAPSGRAPPRLVLRQVERLAEKPGLHPYEITEATSNVPLVDANRRWVQFGVVMNRTHYQYLTGCDLYRLKCFDATANNISFPTGSVELKMAWRVVETCDLPDSPKLCTDERKKMKDRFYMTEAFVQPYGVPARV